MSERTVSCAITYLNNPNGIYFSGQQLLGSAVFTIKKRIKIRSITLTVQGGAWATWDTQEGNMKFIHVGEELLLRSVTVLLGNVNGPEIDLDAGVYNYDFSCLLPNELPTSLDNPSAKILYTVVAFVDRPKKSDNKFLVGFTVFKPLDLNSESMDIRLPIEDSVLNQFCCGVGGLKVHAKIDKSGYIPGQMIEVEININNSSSIKINRIIFALKKILHMTSNANTHCFIYKDVSKHSETNVKNIMNLKKSLVVPSVTPTMLNVSKIIDIVYSIDIIVVVSGCHRSPVLSIPVTIGTIPFRDGTETRFVRGSHDNEIRELPPAYTE